MSSSSDVSHPPLTPLKPVIGNIFELDREHKIDSLVRLAGKYGPFYRVGGLGKYRYVATTQDLVNELCDETRFAKSIFGPIKEIKDRAADGTLLTSETDDLDWGQAHRILMPLFGPLAVREMFPQMLDIADQMFTRWEMFGPDSVIDLDDNMMRLTFDTIAYCAFSTRLNSFYRESNHPFIEAMVSLASELDQRWTKPKWLKQLQRTKLKQYEADWQVIADVTKEIIDKRRKDPQGAEKNDVLNRLLNATDPQTGEKLKEESIPYQMAVFLAAGHDTTGGMLSFATYFLLKNPKILKKARDLVDEVVGEGPLRIEHLSQLGYLEQILMESLRLYPTAPVFNIKPKQDTVLAGEYPLTTDDSVLILVFALHRDPKVWDEPDTFRPERFSPENIAKLPPNAWKPFGNGARSCIGRAFALQEATVAMALMLQRFDMSFVDPSYELEVVDALTLKPKDIKVRARVRRPGLRHAPAEPQQRVVSVVREMPKVSGRALSADATPLLVLYGSNAGSAETFARRVAAAAAGQGFAARLAPMDDYAQGLPRQGALVVVTASYNGNPPDNAVKFVSAIETAEADSLQGLSFAVFGCGNRQWHETFQAIPNRVDAALARAGASRVTDRGLADFAGDLFESSFDDWSLRLWPSLSRAFGKEPSASPLSSTANVIKIDFERGGREKALRLVGLVEGVVAENRELVDTNGPDARSRRHLEIALPEGVSYRAGDYLAVLARNPASTVARVLRRFGLAHETRVHISNASAVFDLPQGQAIGCGELLEGYVELSQPASPSQVAALAAATRCPPERLALEGLADADYQSEVIGKRLSVLDLLERFQSCPLDFAGYLAMLPPMKIRQYSISSSPLWKADHLTLTVTVVDAPAFSGQGRFRGVASSYLAELQPGDRLSLGVQPSNESFHPPVDPATPIIMVCAGSGIAPFRGFLQQRALQKAAGDEVGPSLLFFGVRHPDVDYLYREELAQWQEAGVVQVFSAFSRQPDGDIRYVQERFWAERQAVFELFQKGASVFVCGDGNRMVPAVRETFVRIYQEAAGVNEEQAHKWLADMEFKEGRYAADIFT